MWFGSLERVNCRGCYGCVKACPVDAIVVKNGKAGIVKERCIVCGRCSQVCQKSIKYITSDRKIIKEYIKSGDKVIASLAPSFAAVYGEYSKKVPTALKKLGFDYVEETVVGLNPIIDEYSTYADKDNSKNYIASLCPSIVNLIQKHYPELIENLIPIISPYICHTKLLKEKYGKDVKIVFIGSCIAKKEEAYEEESIDAILTFRELDKWIRGEGIKLEALEDTLMPYIDEEKRLYPIMGNLSRTIRKNNPKKKIYYIDGMGECKETLQAMKESKIDNVFFEMNACRHGCVCGSGMPRDNSSYYERKENIENYIKDNCDNVSLEYEDVYKEIYENDKVCIDRKFESLHVKLKTPTEEEITQILNKMGKYRKIDQLNCGNCGYLTCREKAIAVYNDMAEITMCLPFMKARSENLANVVLDTTPNLILIVNQNLEIVDMNVSARKFFDVKGGLRSGIPLVMFLEEDKFKEVIESKINIIKEKINISYNKATVIQSIIWLEDSQVMIWIGDDITKDENRKKKYQSLKIDAINMSQKVINKQMVVAQEIASLLGETTAETKVILTQLKNLIQEEGDRL